MKRYNPSEIEPKWQKIWEEGAVYAAHDNSAKPKKYVVGQFPYPSGAGLHAGHAKVWTIVDAVGRFYRQNGYNVMHPMGWDTFGMPAENYAIKTGVSPQEATKMNIKNFKKQFKRMGMAIDWSREINTSHPEYYRWTQWIFEKLYENDLAYRAENYQWWCPIDKTVLANEQVENGKCWRCGSEVEKKKMRQWFFRITKYAEELLAGLDDIDWPESVKAAQRNWIGKSTGAEIDFEVEDTPYFVGKMNPIQPDKEFTKRKFVQVFVYDPKTDKYLADKYKKFPWISMVGGGIDNGEDVVAAARREVLEETGYKNLKFERILGKFRSEFYAANKGVNRDLDATQVLFTLENDERVEMSDEEKNIQEPVWLSRDEFKEEDMPAYEETMLGFERIDGKRPNYKITTFTTRPDTMFGITFLVLAPEHPLVGKITTDDRKREVEQYRAATLKKSDIERQENKEKTGVFTGAYVINPANGERVPVWVGDFVIAGYGTGAVLATPSHDERDWEFAQKFDLPVRQTLMPSSIDSKNPPKDGLKMVTRDTMMVHLRDKSTGLYALLKWHESLEGIVTAIMGGIEDDETAEEAALRELKEEAGLENVKIIKKSQWMTSAQYCASHNNENRTSISETVLAEVDNLKNQKTVDKGETKNHTLVWVTEDKVRETLTPDDQKLNWDLLMDDDFNKIMHDEGVMINSDPFDWLNSPNREDWRIEWAKSQGLIPEFGKSNPAETQVYGTVILGYNPKTNKYLGLRSNVKTKTGQTVWIPGGNIQDGETFEQCARREFKEETGYTPQRLVRLGPPVISHYYNSKKESYRRSFAAHYIAIVDGEPGETARESHESFHDEWLDYDQIYKENADFDKKDGRGHWLDLLERAKRFVDNSMEIPEADQVSFNGLSSPEMREKVVKWLAKRGDARFKTTYKMRDWLISRQRYWGAPIPIAYDKDGKEHLIPEKDLPVVLPIIDDYKPDDSGRSALAKSPKFTKVIINGEEMTRETDTMDGFACSSWYLLRYADPRNNKQAWDPKKINYWNPVDYYVGGEHSTTHMLYVRMWTMFFRDLGLTDFAEPITKFMKNGQILAADGTKMSKSKGNTIDPLEVIDSGYGADALRTYILFMVPPNMDAAWSLQGLGGVHRFLARVWNLVQEFLESKSDQKLDAENAEKLNRVIHKTIKKVTRDMKDDGFNTAVAAMMECINDLYKLKESGFGNEWRESLSNLMLLLAPFAPHLAAELFESLGNKPMIEEVEWPKWDEKYLISDSMTIAVQVNGKLRGEISVAVDAPQSEIEKAALNQENAAKFIGGKAPKKIIYVPGKIVNVVI